MFSKSFRQAAPDRLPLLKWLNVVLSSQPLEVQFIASAILLNSSHLQRVLTLEKSMRDYLKESDSLLVISLRMTCLNVIQDAITQLPETEIEKRYLFSIEGLENHFRQITASPNINIKALKFIKKELPKLEKMIKNPIEYQKIVLLNFLDHLESRGNSLGQECHKLLNHITSNIAYFENCESLEKIYTITGNEDEFREIKRDFSRSYDFQTDLDILNNLRKILALGNDLKLSPTVIYDYLGTIKSIGLLSPIEAVVSRIISMAYTDEAIAPSDYKHRSLRFINGESLSKIQYLCDTQSIFCHIWHLNSPNHVRYFFSTRFNFFESSNNVLPIDPTTTPIISKHPINSSPIGVTIWHQLNTLDWNNINSPVTILRQEFVGNRFVGHVTPIFLERDANREWRAIVIDAADSISQDAVIIALENQPQIKSVIVYTRYHHYDAQHNEYVKRALQGSHNECGAVAIHLMSILTKRAESGVNIFDELIAHWKQCQEHMHLVSGEMKYNSDRYSEDGYTKVIAVPFCAAPAYIVKVSQSEIILADWAVLHNDPNMKAIIHNRRRETLKQYRDRHGSKFAKADVIQEKYEFYADRWLKTLSCFMLTGERPAGFDVFATQPDDKKPTLPLTVTVDPAHQEFVAELNNIMNYSLNTNTSSLTLVSGAEAVNCCLSPLKDQFRDADELLLLKGYMMDQKIDSVYFELIINLNAVEQPFGYLHLASTEFSAKALDNRIYVDFIFNSFHPTEGFLMTGLGHGFRYHADKDIFDRVLPYYIRKEEYKKFFQFEYRYIDCIAKYIGYDEKTKCYGRQVDYKNFPLERFLMLAFAISFPKFEMIPKNASENEIRKSTP